MSSLLQPLKVDFTPFDHFALLPSPTSFFNGQSGFNTQPALAAFAADATQDFSDANSASSYSPEASSLLDYSGSQAHSSRSPSPASSYGPSPSPKVENVHLSAGQHSQAAPQYERQQQPQSLPIDPLSASVLLQGAQAHYKSQDFQVRASQSQHPQHFAQSDSQMAATMLDFNQQFQYSAPLIYHQPQQQQQRTSVGSNSALPFFSAAAPFSQGGAQFATPAPAPFVAAPSFTTPQGTFYFVPNVPNTAAGPIPVTSGLPAPASASHARSESASSWDADIEAPTPVKKSGKKGKNQTKRFICPHEGCGRGFARNFNMQSHLKSHLGIRDFDCPRCTKKFSRRHDRARHCAAVHDLIIPARAGSSVHDDDDDDENDFEG